MAGAGGRSVNKTCVENPVPVYEIMTFLNQRSTGGRVVINPPEKMAPLEMHTTGEMWYCCNICGRSTTDQSKHLKHVKEHRAMNKEPTPCPEKHSNNPKDEGPDSGNGPLITLAVKNLLKKLRPAQLACNCCSATFPRIGQLRSHLSSKHNIDSSKTVKCSICEKSFASIRPHIRKYHNPSNKFQCSRCTYTYPTIELLNIHKIRFHKPKSARSQRYKKIRRNKKNLAHLKRMKKLPNSSGGSSASNPASPLQPQSQPEEETSELDQLTVTPILSQDKNILKKNVFYRCKRCPFITMDLTSLRNHFSTHMNELLTQCDLCPMKFRLHSSLWKHLKTSHGNGTYKCPHCTCRFLSIIHCRHHISKCEGRGMDVGFGKILHVQKLHGCRQCPLRFRMASTLVSHVQAAHSGGPYQCPRCSCCFHSTNQWQRHIKLHHSEVTTIISFQTATAEDNATSKLCEIIQ